MDKQTLARMREGAGRADAPSSVGKVQAIYGCDRAHRLFLIGDSGVSSGQLADHIDPERTNPGIPWMVQREEINYGTSTTFIRQTVALGAELLRKGGPLAKDFDREQAFLTIIEIARSLAEVADTISELSLRENQIREQLAAKAISRSVLPRTQNLKGRVNQAIGHLADVRIAAVQVLEQFYAKSAPNVSWAGSLREGFSAQVAGDDPNWPVIDQAISELLSLQDYRNALEHRRANQFLDIWDYDLLPSGDLAAPSLQIQHAKSSRERQDVVAFLANTSVGAANAFESLFVLACDLNSRAFGDLMRERVVRLPEGELNRGSDYMWQGFWLTPDGNPPAAPS